LFVKGIIPKLTKYKSENLNAFALDRQQVRSRQNPKLLKPGYCVGKRMPKSHLLNGCNAPGWHSKFLLRCIRTAQNYLSLRIQIVAQRNIRVETAKTMALSPYTGLKPQC
jgi:hypothetical protein